MTLDKAVAKYNETVGGMYCFDPKECQMCAEDKVALDAAVKYVALAVESMCYRNYSRLSGRTRTEIKAEIERRFSEGRKAGSGTGPCPSCLPGTTQCSGMDFSKEGTAMAQGSEARLG